MPNSIKNEFYPPTYGPRPGPRPPYGPGPGPGPPPYSPIALLCVPGVFYLFASIPPMRSHKKTSVGKNIGNIRENANFIPTMGPGQDPGPPMGPGRARAHLPIPLLPSYASLACFTY